MSFLPTVVRAAAQDEAEAVVLQVAEPSTAIGSILNEFPMVKVRVLVALLYDGEEEAASDQSKPRCPCMTLWHEVDDEAPELQTELVLPKGIVSGKVVALPEIVPIIVTL